MFTTENKDGKWWVVESRSNEFWTNARPSKQYPTLPEHASHWAALQGKMFGEGEFEVSTFNEPQGYAAESWRDVDYAIPKQAEERGVKDADYVVKLLKDIEARTGLETSLFTNDEWNIILGVLYSKQSQPAIPASDEEGWEEVEREADRHARRKIGVHRDWLDDSEELEYYIIKMDYLKQNYSLTKK